MLAFNMMVPPKVRLGMSNRPLNVDDMLRSLTLPVLVTHGAEDKNINLIAAEYTAKMIPGANCRFTRASATRLSLRTRRASTRS
jgi:pimeloyl-ACP methyl ester carboxylesterase